jgi:predicted DNA-binding transcriptional regulator YafY
VAPYKVWFYNETFYLIGLCLLRQDIRLFAIDRIEAVTLTDETFDIPEGFDAESFMNASFGVFQGSLQTVRIRFRPQAAGYVKEKIWHPSQTIADQPDGSVIFTVKVAGVQEIKYWVLKWGSAAEVLSPDLLRREVSEEISAMQTLYSGKTHDVDI